MAEAKKTGTVLKKDRSVSIKAKNGLSYSYKFTTLPEIHRYLDETKQHYEAYIKKVEGEDYMFIRKLSEDQDEIVELQGAKIPPVTGIKDYGGALTACRRYSLLMAYGLACEDDDSFDNKGATLGSSETLKKMTTPSSKNPPSDKQRITIRNLAVRLGKGNTEALRLLNSVSSAAEASDLIKKLGEELDAREQNSI